MGVTLWLVPPAEDALKLKRIMYFRSGRTPSDSSYPKFDPHLTLASLPPGSKISLSTLRSSIPTSQLPLQVDFKTLEIGSHYFRSVYLAIKPTAALSALHEHIHSSLGVQPRTPSFPHVSLCYIDDQDAKEGERESFVLDLESSGRVKRNGKESVSLNCGEAGHEDWLAGFEAPEVWIVNCEGPVEEWEVLEKILLA